MIWRYPLGSGAVLLLFIAGSRAYAREMDDLKKIQDAASSGDVSALIDQMGSGDSGGLLSGFTFWGIFWGFAFSVFGWWIFKQGRKKTNPGLIGIGIALMVYPYFVTSPWPCFLIGAGLCGAARFIWDRY